VVGEHGKLHVIHELGGGGEHGCNEEVVHDVGVNGEGDVLAVAQEAIEVHGDDVRSTRGAVPGEEPGDAQYVHARMTAPLAALSRPPCCCAQ
jgi:hypothetical protein